MEIFISWSGLLSRDIAHSFSTWLPKVIQACKPYYSPDDIRKGTKWNSELTAKLESISFGILIITKDNMFEPWIQFEAGALSSGLSESHVCPILIDLTNAELVGPLSTFQTTDFESGDILKLLSTINGQLKNPLEESTLRETFNMFYPLLEKEVKKLIIERNETRTTKNVPPPRSEKDLLQEILELTRQNHAQLQQKQKSEPEFRVNESEFSKKIVGKAMESLVEKNVVLNRRNFVLSNLFNSYLLEKGLNKLMNKGLKSPDLEYSLKKALNMVVEPNYSFVDSKNRLIEFFKERDVTLTNDDADLILTEAELIVGQIGTLFK